MLTWVLIIFFYGNDGRLIHKEESGGFKTSEECEMAGKLADNARTTRQTWSCVPRNKGK